MTTFFDPATQRPGPRPEAERVDHRLVLASRGDALTPYLFEALAERFPIGGRLRPELTQRQRFSVAAGTFRLSRSARVEQFFKSGRGYRFRSANAARQRARLNRPQDPVFQVHALFEVPGARTLLYVDCTHAQSARHWPAWNPLRGEALENWFRREQRAYAEAEHIFAFSRAGRQSLVTDYGVDPERVTVVGAGITLEKLPDPRPSVPGRPTLLFVGNDFARKGGHLLLEAFRRVRSRYPDARLQLVGTDPGVAAEPGVEVLGRVRDRARLGELYSGASLFVLPSIFDPFPLVLLEAMAHGVAVVTTTQVGVADHITPGRDGLLVPAGEAGALAAGLIDALADPARTARIGAAGRALVTERFTWAGVVDRMAPALHRSLRT